MPLRAPLAVIAALILASLACNLQRVLDPSLPTSTPGSATQQSTAIPTATGAPALTAGARVASADKLFFYGDWDAALREYQRVYEGEDEGLRGAALLGAARSLAQLDRNIEAKNALNTLFNSLPDSEAVPAGYFALAEIYEAENNPAAAAQAYQEYLTRRPNIIDGFVQERRADALFAAGDYEGALAAYQAASAAPQLAGILGLQIKVGNVHMARQDYQAAILAYQTVYTNTANDYLKADMDLQIGRAYAALGDSSQAQMLYLDAVTKYPLAYSSYAALVELVNAGVAVDELQRGLIDYYAATNNSGSSANELYLVAIAAFDRYLENAPADHADTAHYFRALSLRASGNYPAALNEFEHIITQHEFSDHWFDAFLEKADIQWRNQDDYDAALATLEGFVVAYPGHPNAPLALYTAGKIAEVGGRLTRAAEILPRIANEYPASEYAYDALHLAGISRYRLEDYAGAQSLFVRANQAALSLEEQAQSLFWIAKAQQAQGNQSGAQITWQSVTAIDPTGYYSERAKDILAGLAPFAPPSAYTIEFDAAAERSEAEAWIRSTFSLPPETDLSQLGSLQQDARFVRGTELWNLGEYEAARSEFESLRAELVSDPANSYRLANYLIDLGLYRTAIFAAREVLNMAGMSDASTMNAPVYFNRIRFGLYYNEFIEPEARGEGIDPLFVYSMMRQESLFEGFVTSSAGARGLLQIVPSTGQEMATLSGWPPNFTPDDLYRPAVSIRLGVDYLARQLNAFDGDLYTALAAYNAGPGNAVYWQGQAKGDPDLFVEIVQFEETRNHIRSIYELYDIYRDLYSE
jgi:soluble lytic murein transglycosylase